MVTVEIEKCSGCGTCVDVCHEHCMSVVDGKVEIYDPYCSTCAQCVAICPSRALSWDNVAPIRFEPELMPTPEQMNELFKERRTVRAFKPTRVDRTLLEEVASYAAYAPTHSHALRIVIVDEAAIIDLMDRILLRFTARLYRFVYRPKLVGSLAKVLTPSLESEFLRAKPKLETTLRRGVTFTSRPAAFILVVGEKRTPLNLESAQYATYNMNLLAQAMGLGCRNLVGNQSILNRSRALREELRLKKSERIFGLLGIGHPEVKFVNKVEGRSLSLQWNGRGTDDQHDR
jgi:nitroreductase/NAD-dependent dihydropyrimidine dehydrogenase PreA subunit